MAAARAWAFAHVGRADPAQAATVDVGVQAQFAELGIAVDVDREADDDIPVWAINWPSLKAFLACETQWRVVVGGSSLIWLGLDYAGADVALRHRGADAHIFADLQVMERAALDAMQEARE